jgi:cytochrome P450
MDLFSPATRRDPYPLYDQLRATSPVLHLPGPDLWVVFGHDAVKRALSDHETFSSNVGPSRGNRFEWLLFMDPPRHTQLRAILGRAFTARSIAGLAPRIRALTRELLDRVGDPDCDRGELDLVADLATPLPMMVIAELLGLPIDDWRRLAGWSEAIVNLGNTIAGGDAEHAAAEFARADAEMTGYLATVIAARRGQPAGDLISRLVTAEPGGEPLDAPAITRFCQLLLAAGTETTTNLIDNAVLCFAAHPDQLARVRARPDLLPQAIEEVLRYRTPVQAMFRATRCAVELDGARIPAGAFVIAMIGAANRDPGRFAEPARFDVARAPNPHLAFGHGIHFCLGAPLSRLEAGIALAELLGRFAQLELASPDWPPRGSFHVHGPAALPVRFRRAGPALHPDPPALGDVDTGAI